MLGDAFWEGLVVHSRTFSASCVDLFEVSNVCTCVCVCVCVRETVCRNVCRDLRMRFCVSICVLVRICLALRICFDEQSCQAQMGVIWNLQRSQVPFWCIMAPSKYDDANAQTWNGYMRIKCARSAHEDSSIYIYIYIYLYIYIYIYVYIYIYITGVPFPGPRAGNHQIPRSVASAKSDF